MLAFGVALTMGIASDVRAQEREQGSETVQQSLATAAAHLERGEAASALSALRPIEAAEPENPWMWFYRGVARGRMGDLYEALEAYDHALDALSSFGDPDPALRLRAAARRRDVRRSLLRLTLQIGLAYDSNVTFRGGGTTGALVTGRGNGKFASTLRVDFVPWARADEVATVGVSIANAWHFSIDEFNYQDYGLYARYASSLDNRWSFQVQYNYDMTYLGNKTFLSNHALNPRITYTWPESSSRVKARQTSLDYRIEARDFLIDTLPAFDRDGFANSVGLTHRFRLQAGGASDAHAVQGSVDMQLGYRLESVATEGTEFDRLTDRFFLTMDFPLADAGTQQELRCRFEANWELVDYRENSLIDRRRRHRDDLITTLGVVLSKRLRSGTAAEDLTLHLLFNWTDSDSNVQTRTRSTPFSYDKIVAGAQLEWRF